MFEDKPKEDKNTRNNRNLRITDAWAVQVELIGCLIRAIFIVFVI